MFSKALVTLVSRLVIRFDKPDGSSCQLLNRLTSLYLQDVTFPQHEQVRWEIQGVPTKIFFCYTSVRRIQLCLIQVLRSPCK